MSGSLKDETDVFLKRKKEWKSVAHVVTSISHVCHKHCFFLPREEIDCRLVELKKIEKALTNKEKELTAVG